MKGDIPIEHFTEELVSERPANSTISSNMTLTDDEKVLTVLEEKTSAAAWIETIVCIGVSASCAFMWATGASSPNIMSKWMDVSLTQINWLSNASAICNTAFSLSTAWAYERFGIKASVYISDIIRVYLTDYSLSRLFVVLC